MQNTILKFFYGALIAATVSTTGAAITKISAGNQTARAEARFSTQGQIISNLSEKSDSNKKSENTNPSLKKISSSDSLNNSNENNHPEEQESSKTALQIKTSAQATTTALAVQSSSTSPATFTLAELAAHNNANSCYIAHNGTVYDVTNVSSWTNCKHHGATGGIDITASFPHPVSYLNSANKVGLLSSNSAVTNNPSSGQIDQINQNNNVARHDGDEDEHEDHESED